jgi:hypothetical protein
MADVVQLLESIPETLPAAAHLKQALDLCSGCDVQTMLPLALGSRGNFKANIILYRLPIRWARARASPHPPLRNLHG